MIMANSVRLAHSLSYLWKTVETMGEVCAKENLERIFTTN